MLNSQGSTLALIPARAGSKGIPGKNVRPLAGRPLLAYAIEAATGARTINRIILSTDSEAIAALGRACGADTPFLRPSELAQDDTPALPVILHALDWLQSNEAYRPDIVVLLQPTAPLRTAEHIDGAVGLLIESRADSVVSVAETPRHFHPGWQLVIRDGELRRHDAEPLAALSPTRQSLEATYYRNGAIYACRRETLLVSHSLYGGHCRPYVMPAEASINLDTELEWQLAELILRSLSGSWRA